MPMYVTIETARKIIETRRPRGVFWCRDGGVYIGIDNRTGDAWVEQFDDFDKCMAWLEGEDDE